LHDGRFLGKALGQLEHLKIADLSHIAVETHGVRHILSGLQSCAKLEDLSISFPSKYQDEFLTTFKKFTALKCLRVTKNCIEGRNWTGGIPGYDGTNIINRRVVMYKLFRDITTTAPDTTNGLIQVFDGTISGLEIDYGTDTYTSWH
jgi:hypothetical protein